MRKMRKSISILLIIVLCLGVVPGNCFVSEIKAAETIEGYYGKQLTQEQKQYYLILKEAYIGESDFAKVFSQDISITLSEPVLCDTEGELEAAAREQMIAANYGYMALIHDYPQVFWTNGIGVGYQYRKYSTGEYELTTITLQVADAIAVDNTMLAEYNTGIQAAVAEVVGGLATDAEVYDYYKAIHDWVCEQITYNYTAVGAPESHREAYTSYPVFTQEAGASVVCEGYGETYKILCDQIKRQYDIDLECVLIDGVGVTDDGQENHLWNAVRMPDNNWYGVDATWDDQTTIIDTYFLCGKTTVGISGHTFSIDHVANPQVSSVVTLQYPDIATYGYGVENTFDWNYKNGTLTITGSGELPDYLAGEGAPWYQYKDDITTVEISKDIECVPEGLLANYKNIKNLNIPFVGLTRDSVDDEAVLGILFGKTSSGVYQYYKAEGGSYYYYYYAIPKSLEKVTVTDADKLSLGAFHNCSNLKSIILNEGIETIASYSIAACASLVEIVIPSTVTSIEEYALNGCRSLQNITLPFVGSGVNANESYDAVFGYIFGRADAGVSQYYKYNAGSYSGYKYQIPTTLKKVVITKDTSIPTGAFSGCASIHQIELCDDVQKVGVVAFYNCTGLKSIYFKGNAPEIQSNAFSGCGTLKALIPKNNSTWKASNKLNYSAEQINWESVNTVDTLAKIASAKISLQDKIAVKFLVTLDDSVSQDDYLKVLVNGKESLIKVSQATKTVSSLTGEERYVFVCKVNSKEMTKTIKAQMVVGGEEGTSISYSVKKYTDAVLALSEGLYEKEKTMIRAMLNYGGYAQQYFLTDIELQQATLANASLYTPETDPVLTTTAFNLDSYKATGEHLDRLGVSLLLESETELRIYFTPEAGKTVNDYSFSVVGVGNQWTTGMAEGKCYVAITGIEANELHNMYTVTITSKANGSLFASTTCGAFTYVKTVLEDNSQGEKLKNLVKAIYLYHAAAVEYGN